MARKLPSRFQPYKNIIIGPVFIERFCTRCKKWMPISHFGRDPKRFYGYYSQCKNCLNSYGEFYRQRDLKTKWDAGDNTLKICGCGRIYQFLKANGTKNGSILDACRFCLKDGNNLRNN